MTVTRTARVLLALGLVALVLAPTVPTAQQPRAAFTSRSERVRLEVSVRRGDTPLEGLTASDFDIRDNGVPQQVLSADPLRGAHVVLALDVSGSVVGDLLAQQKEAALEVLSRLTPDDRASIVAFADDVRVLARVSTDGALLGHAVAPLQAAGGTALHDALVVTSALGRADERPAVVLLFTDGADSSSWASAQRALDHLRRHDAVVFPIVPTGAQATTARRGTDSILDPLRHPFWIAPGPGDTERLLAQVARVTGGDVVTSRASARLLETFADVLRRYRQRYVVSFEPSGAPTEGGWHRVDVKVPGHRATVQARDGYWAGQR